MTMSDTESTAQDHNAEPYTPNHPTTTIPTTRANTHVDPISIMKAYIDESIRSSTTSIIQSIKQYIDFQLDSNLNKQRQWNEQLQANITNALSQMTQTNIRSSIATHEDISAPKDHAASS
ncbi:44294_t:CDS:1 [Gigaspora margarita]|uniref:44294_t:CDS:1 n=1 Tax=Gigaspora margarita TaxID=4874 RepID=A0ABN7VRG4_GIGMA|nr:44294_t:CDS:1 [Gigaspora margarita]